MTLEESIVEWAATRPAWQRQVMVRLASGDLLGSADYNAIGRALVAGEAFSTQPLGLSHIPGTGDLSLPVRLQEVRRVAHVNALVPEQTLTFGLEGITVIYGDNGSGKSGYARLLKQVVRARHSEEILTDVFTDAAGVPQTAQVVAVVGDGEDVVHDWPGPASPVLARITFFDEACGDAYIASDSEVTYRPAALFLLDGLIVACDEVRAEVDRHIDAARGRATPLPRVADDTRASVFLASLSATTTAEAIEAACAVPADVATAIERLRDEEGHLRAADAPSEHARLLGVAQRVERLGTHLSALDTSLGGGAVTALVVARARATALRNAAEVAASTSFESEPLAGVGSETWRALWEAAREYSQREAYQGHEFPHTGTDSRCVLCRQELRADAQDRLVRFEAAVADHTSREAGAAELVADQAAAAVEAVRVETVEAQVALQDLEQLDPAVAAACRSALDAFGTVRARLLGPAPAEAANVTPGTAAAVERLNLRVAALQDQARSLDAAELERRLHQVTRERVEMEAQSQLSELREDIDWEVARRRELNRLNEVRRSTDTTGITRKSTELMREHVTAIVRDWFTRESDRLDLQRVTLQDVGGQKGQLRHRPAFVGAAQQATIPRVLSEGEQTALGLAGFFTEAHLDTSRAALVLDDPVCSLDHIRRGKVAVRLADLARDRQVIVFTHDHAFVTELRQAADQAGIALTERTVERTGDGRPGSCVDAHPWRTKDVKARLGTLEEDLARIKRDSSGWSSDTYEKEVCDWAGKLSEAWERAVLLDVVGRVVDRSTMEVRPRLFRLFAEITADDNKELQESYGRCSQWARRHDKSPETNYTAPTTAELEAELKLVRSWWERLRKYAS